MFKPAIKRGCLLKIRRFVHSRLEYSVDSTRVRWGGHEYKRATRKRTAQALASMREKKRLIVDTRIISDASEANELSSQLVHHLTKGEGRFHAWDVETTGVDPRKQSPVGVGRLLCSSVCIGPHGPVYVIDNYDEDLIQYFRAYFEDDSLHKVWHNYGFDRHILFNHGIDAHGMYRDTLHMARLVQAGGAKRGSDEYVGYSLSALTSKTSALFATDSEGNYLHQHADLLAEVTKENMESLFRVPQLLANGTLSRTKTVPPTEVLHTADCFAPEWIRYSAVDAVATWRLASVLESMLSKIPWIVPKFSIAIEDAARSSSDTVTDSMSLGGVNVRARSDDKFKLANALRSQTSKRTRSVEPAHTNAIATSRTGCLTLHRQASSNASAALRSDETLKSKNGSMLDFYDTYWRPYGVLLTDMERAGLGVNKKKLSLVREAAIEDFRRTEEKFRLWAFEYCGIGALFVNLSSHPQKKHLLFGEGAIDIRVSKEQLLSWVTHPSISTETVTKLQALIDNTPHKWTTVSLEGMCLPNPFLAYQPGVQSGSGSIQAVYDEAQSTGGTHFKRTQAIMSRLAGTRGKNMLPRSRDDPNVESGRSAPDPKVALVSWIPTMEFLQNRKESFKGTQPHTLLGIPPSRKRVDVSALEKRIRNRESPSATAGIERLMKMCSAHASWCPSSSPAKSFMKECEQAASFLLDIAAANKIISGFVQPLERLTSPNSRVHCSLNIHTETGRLSARTPNLQNQPMAKDKYGLRSCFEAADGNILVIADYSQLELRVLCELARIDSMYKAIVAGRDLHSTTATQMFPFIARAIKKQCGEDNLTNTKEVEKIVKERFSQERKVAKIINFSVLYGKSVGTLSEDLLCSESAAGWFVTQWFRAYPEVEYFQEAYVAGGHRFGKVFTMLGRFRTLTSFKNFQKFAGTVPSAVLGSDMPSHSVHRHVPYGMRTYVPAPLKQLRRLAANTAVQGSAADIVMLAMLRIHHHRRLRELGFRIVLQIHDELILEGPEEHGQEALNIVIDAMQNPFPKGMKVSTPFDVDADLAKNWAGKP